MDSLIKEPKREQKEQLDKVRMALENIKEPIDYGTIKIQMRAGKATLLTVETTIRLD